MYSYQLLLCSTAAVLTSHLALRSLVSKKTLLHVIACLLLHNRFYTVLTNITGHKVYRRNQGRLYPKPVFSNQRYLQHSFQYYDVIRPSVLQDIISVTLYNPYFPKLKMSWPTLFIHKKNI